MSEAAVAVAAAPTSSHALSFVVEAGEITFFWSPQRTAEYEVECARGRAYADELLAHIRSTGNPVIFGSVLRAMTEGGVYGGAEIGFCSRIGIELIGLRR